MDGTQPRRGGVVVVVLLLLAVVAPVTVAGQAEAAQPETDNTLTHVTVHANGSATWTVTIRTRLDTDERVAEYEAFQERFRANTSRYLDPFRTRMRGVVANAANVTGREMRATGFAASTAIQEVPRRWGVVSYRFTWTNFATSDGDTLRVGDVFQGGFFLATNDTLELEAPDGYRFESVEPGPDATDDGQVAWVGREDFTDGHPQAVLVPAAATGTGTEPGATDGTDGSTTGSGLPGGSTLAFVLGGLLLLGLVGGGAYALRRREADTADRSAPDRRPDEPATAQPAEPNGGTAAEAEAEAESTADLVTDAERVERLLAENGGRLRQAAIADEFDWSASKTSRVVADMVDDGTVEKLQLGRENVIDLAEEGTD